MWWSDSVSADRQAAFSMSLFRPQNQKFTRRLSACFLPSSTWVLTEAVWRLDPTTRREKNVHIRWYCDDLCRLLSFSPDFLISIRFNWDQSLDSSSIVWDYFASGTNLLELSVDIQITDIQAKTRSSVRLSWFHSPIVNFRRENGREETFQLICVWMKKKLNHRQTGADGFWGCVSLAFHMDCLPARQPKPAHTWLVSSTGLQPDYRWKLFLFQKLVPLHS